MNVIYYVTEEVSRQGHDVLTLDGLERVGWMLNAWAETIRCNDVPLNIDIVQRLGMQVEPDKNRMGFRPGAVRVGTSKCPPAHEVVPLLNAWLSTLPSPGVILSWAEALGVYLNFELIHPFNDGNGRTGKLILARISGRLLSPDFPPSDFWGRVIRNP